MKLVPQWQFVANAGGKLRRKAQQSQLLSAECGFTRYLEPEK